MRELVLEKMENAFGIKKLRVNIDSDKRMFQELIYSRNGTFKTSFSSALYEINNGSPENIIDRLTNEKSFLNVYILKDNKKINDLRNKFIIFSREIYEKESRLIKDYNKEIEILTVDKKDSEYLETLLTEDTLEIRIEIDNYLKGTGQSFDSILDIFTNNNDGYLDRVIDLLTLIIEYESKDISEINIKKIFQKAYDMIDDDKFQEKVDNYIDVLKNKMNAELFDEYFNESNCLSFVSSIDKSKFLNKEKNRGININGENYYDTDSIRKIFQDEINKISSDPDVIEQSKELSKTIGNSKEAENLKDSIQKNPLLIKQLSIGRKNILLSYLKDSNIDFKHWLDIVKNTKNELNKLLKLAVNKKTNFEKAIDIYRNRFNPSFEIEIINREESLLGLEVPSIVFHHKRNKQLEIDETKLNNILSSGEKTTLNILKFIVEYETNKNNEIFIILDDIVETFDYSNRYAFIEYINDLTKLEIPIIVLTHNFEFYNSVGKRIKKLRRSVAISNDEGVVDIQKNNKINKNMEQILACNNIYDFLAAIPYLREAKTILYEDTACLDSCLHYKAFTKQLKLGDILSLFPKECIENLSVNSNSLYIEELKITSSKLSNFDNFDIVKKTVLALASRVIIEEKIIGNNFKLIEGVSTNQTSYILDNYGNKLNDDVRKCLENVQLSTPDFIHGNTFMYEPLIDIDGSYLESLYNDVLNIDENKVWKMS